MTNEELNRKAAEIMGFDGNHRNFGDTWYVPSNDSAWKAFLKKDWNPCENIAQAVLLPKRDNLLMNMICGYDDGKPYAEVTFDEELGNQIGGFICSDAENLEKAMAMVITRACVAAWEKKK